MVPKRQVDISSKKAQTALLLTLCLLTAGCSMKGGGPSLPGVHAPKRSGVFISDLYQQALFYSSISLQGRLRMTVRSRKFPSVKVRAWLLCDARGPLIRLKGFAPFGITVFDLLAKRDRAWIFLPRSGQVYQGSRFFTDYGAVSVRAAVLAMEMVLNPWSPVRRLELRQTECQGAGQDIFCLAGDFLDNHLVFEYRSENLLPQRFRSKDFEVEFSGALAQPLVYPQEAIFSFSSRDILGKLTFSSVERAPLRKDSSLFDESYFLRIKRANP